MGPPLTYLEKSMNALNIKIEAFKSLYEKKDPFAALTNDHKDWQRDNELTEQLCIIKQEILALGGKEEFDAVVAEFKQKRDEADKRLEEFNKKHQVEMMLIQYKHQYGWHNLDEQDQRFEERYGELWLQHRDDIWQKVCPKHRSKRYAQEAIAESKLLEVCHD